MIVEYFNKAQSNLKVAQYCFDNGFYDDSANRSYYAILHAAIAALASRGIKKDKIDHGWVQSEFSGKLIKRQKIYPSKCSISKTMSRLRNTCTLVPTALPGNAFRRALPGYP